MLTRPATLLHIEEAVILLLILFAYHHLHASWLLFAILFLTPDLFMLGYLLNTRVGAATYNLVHTQRLLKTPTYTTSPKHNQTSTHTIEKRQPSRGLPFSLTPD
jgi:hypothetical protein